jgi:hypothetical protein
VDEGAYEGVLGEVLGVRRPEHPPAEAIDRALKAKDERVESGGIATVGAAREVELRPQSVSIGALDRCIVLLDDRTLLAVCYENTGEAREIFRGPRTRASTRAAAPIRLAAGRRAEAP